MMAPFYEQANVEVSGKKSGTTIERVGGSIACGIAMLDKAENKDGVEAFLKYLFDPEGGLAVLQGAAALCSRTRAKR
jgi:molybdate/tungstate transport system substrate-binding protein